LGSWAALLILLQTVPYAQPPEEFVGQGKNTSHDWGQLFCVPASARLQEDNLARDGLSLLVSLECDESQDGFADSQTLLMNVCNTGVLCAGRMDSQKVIVVRNTYSTFLHLRNRVVPGRKRR